MRHVGAARAAAIVQERRRDVAVGFLGDQPGAVLGPLDAGVDRAGAVEELLDPAVRRRRLALRAFQLGRVLEIDGEVEPRRGESRHHRVGRVIGERAAVEADDAAGRQQHDLARRAALGVERDRAGSPICCVCPVHGATMGIAMRLE